MTFRREQPVFTEHATMNRTLKKPVTIVSIAAIALLTIGVAVAQRVELRASEDRFSMGDAHLPVIVD
jgi:hypothetical protein